LKLGKEEFGPDRRHTASFLNNLAGPYHNHGRYTGVESLGQRSLMIREKALGRHK
jgi:hypothetical protein